MGEHINQAAQPSIETLFFECKRAETEITDEDNSYNAFNAVRDKLLELEPQTARELAMQILIDTSNGDFELDKKLIDRCILLSMRTKQETMREAVNA